MAKKNDMPNAKRKIRTKKAKEAKTVRDAAETENLLVTSYSSRYENVGPLNIFGKCWEEMNKSLGNIHILLVTTTDLEKNLILPYSDFELFKESASTYSTNGFDLDEYNKTYETWRRQKFPIETMPIHMVMTPMLRENIY